WITVSGFTFTETPLRGDDGVRCEDSEHLQILRNRFLGIGSRALVVFGKDKACSEVSIQGNEIGYAGGSGIYVGGSAHDCQILDNEVHHCAVYDKYNAGIEFPFYGGTATDVGPNAYTDRIVIAHNYLHDLPRDGIQLGANPYGRNVVEYNRVERTALETVDAGAIRCHRVIAHLQGVEHLPEMAGHILRYNLVADTRGCGASNGEIVTPYPWPTFGIYLDEGSSRCTVFGNIVLRSGVGTIINPGEFNTIENNVLADNAVGIYFQAADPFQQRKPPMGGNRFMRNIVWSMRPESVVYSLRNWTERTIEESDFNLFWNGAGAVVLETQAGPDKPLMKRSLPDWQQVGYDRRSRVADPQFASPSNDDYTLAPTSPATKLGFVPIDVFAIGVRKEWKAK
ncbi:MAG TPA: right-handed parallel beta-helix repeat-containing protein, partial [Pirellulales bacterium]|nr:right-handed parallel beta-helix repeat-containing protein [Pirellulales bacterium]